jgi:hypothetical protein
MLYTIGALVKMMMANSKDILFRPEFFELRYSKVIGLDVSTVKPIAQFVDGQVELKYNVGTRSNGIDKPFWPQNLMEEVVQ